MWIVMGTQKKHTLKSRRKLPYLFISPFFILYTVFGLYPFVSGLILSLQKKDLFVGFSNYQSVLTDTRFWKAISNASLYMLGSIFIILPIALLAALLLNNTLIHRIRGIVSTVFFVPNVTSVIVIGITFKVILRTNNGVINQILMNLGLISKSISFLRNPSWAVWSMIFIGAWRYFGVNSLYFLSGLQNIPGELNEAARIDGASKWQEFAHITLPMLKPISTYIIFTAITGSFSIFGEVLTMLGSDSTGARDSMLYPVLYLYNTMFRDGNMYKAATMGYVIAVILLLITSIQRALMRDKDEGGVRV